MNMPAFQPAIRLQTMHNGPLRSINDYQFGFYDVGFARKALQYLADVDNVENPTFRMATLPIPTNKIEAQIAEAYIRNPNICYSVVDKNKIVLVHINGNKGWLDVYNKLGFEVRSGDKTNKRLKTFHRAALLNAHFTKEELNVMIVDSDEYSSWSYEDPSVVEWIRNEYPNVDVTDPKVIERLLDGGFVISRRIIQRAVENLPVYEPHKTLDTKEYYYDWRVRKNFVKDMMECSVFNARIVFELGFLKGNCIVSDNMPEGVDIITSRTNIKNEILYHNGFQFLAEPVGSYEAVLTDVQTVVNLPKLFPKADLEYWLDEEYKKIFDLATSDKLLTNWRAVYKRQFRKIHEAEDEEAYARMNYVGYRWRKLGMKITDSPWLFETLAISHARPFADSSKPRIPIPCAISEQVIPESLAKMAGFDTEVDQGKIRRIDEIGVHVVSDLDWLEMYESHGGHDEDDYFKLFYRTMRGGEYDGKKVVIICRSPNDHGEYSIFEYTEGDWAPTWVTSDGLPHQFPEINGRDWPKRLSKAIFDGDITYSGLPSSSMPKTKREQAPYSPDDVVRDMHIAMAGGQIGGYVNACMLHSSTLHRHRPVQLCTLETALDKCINPDSIEDVVAIDEETKNIMRQVIDSKIPIDQFMWETRGSMRLLQPNDDLILNENGPLTYMSQLCHDKFTEHCMRVRQWSQDNARPSDERVSQLGNSQMQMYYHALPIVNQFRSGIWTINSSESTAENGSIVRNSWEYLYARQVDIINSITVESDRHDFVLALYQVCLTVPTKAGKITDHYMMNFFVYPYLEAALQYYGIGNNVNFVMNSDGEVKIVETRVTEWKFTDPDGNTTIFNDPIKFQEAQSVYSQMTFNPNTVENLPQRVRSKSKF
jgi:hypothetical protein